MQYRYRRTLIKYGAVRVPLTRPPDTFGTTIRKIPTITILTAVSLDQSRCGRWRSLLWARQLSLERPNFGPINSSLRVYTLPRPRAWYAHVELLVSVAKSSVCLLTGGEFQKPMQMTVEDYVAKKILSVSRSGHDHWSHGNINGALPGRAPCHYCGPCHRGCTAGSYFSSLSGTLPAAATGNFSLRNAGEESLITIRQLNVSRLCSCGYPDRRILARG